MRRPNVARTARRSRHGAPLPPAFFNRETEQVARELLGAVLESHAGGGVTAGRIVETEAYLGEHDLACHAAAGLTARTAPLYGPPGTAYIYFIYGVHWCVNAVTRAEGLPSAVLIRAVEPVEGLSLMRERRPAAKRDADLTNGPGKLCQALAITGALNRAPLDRAPLLIRAGRSYDDSDVVVTRRIGITRCAEWPLRWLVAGNQFVSRTPSDFARHAPHPPPGNTTRRP